MSTLPPEREGALYYRELSNGRDITVYKHTVGQYQVAVGRQGGGDIDSSFYYHRLEAALAAAAKWDGNGDAPVGWFRHPNTGRRREDGDPNKETYRP